MMMSLRFSLLFLLPIFILFPFFPFLELSFNDVLDSKAKQAFSGFFLDILALICY